MSILKMAKADGSHLRELSRIEKQDLLILDDFGIQAFDASGRALLMDIVEDRHGKRSTIIASQVPVKNWYDVIGEQTVADAILDRLVHQSVRVELKGESLRKTRKEETDKII
jgi:DNA replication protein DnaC